MKRLPAGQRDAIKRAMRITAENQAEALFDCGEYEEAMGILRTYSPRADHVALIESVISAIARPDDDHCPCPALDKHEVRRLWVPPRRRFVPLIKCACGHMNASEQPPEDYTALQRAKAEAGKGWTDELVVGRVRQAT